MGALFTGLLPFGVSPALAAKTSLALGMTIDPTGLDPTIAAPVAIGQVTWQNIFEGLVTVDEADKVQPQLARSWEFSPDGLTYTFRRQEGVRFHDGRVLPCSPRRASVFWGLGLAPPAPTWGADAQTYLALAPWLAILPGLAIAITVFGFNRLGDGLRDLLDPLDPRR